MKESVKEWWKIKWEKINKAKIGKGEDKRWASDEEIEKEKCQN